MSTAEPTRSIHVMLVDDDENDVRITRRALKKGEVQNHVTVCRDGEEALAYLLGEGDFGDRSAHPQADLVLLDIHLPKMNGVEVLQAIKANPRLRRIPVLMLTTSTRQEDIAAAYIRGANGFVCKPIEFARFVETVKLLNAYWTSVARCPDGREAGP